MATALANFPVAFPIQIEWNSQIRLASVERSTLEAASSNGFSGALRNLTLLFPPDLAFEKPIAIFQGIERLRYFDGDADWFSADKIRIMVSGVQHGISRTNGRFVNCPAPTNTVFVGYFLEHKEQAIRERLKKEPGFSESPVAKFCGFEWVQCDPASMDLPEGHKTRYNKRIK